jgi:hypothetical protein
MKCKLQSGLRSSAARNLHRCGVVQTDICLREVDHELDSYIRVSSTTHWPGVYYYLPRDWNCRAIGVKAFAYHSGQCTMPRAVIRTELNSTAVCAIHLISKSPKEV